MRRQAQGYRALPDFLTFLLGACACVEMLLTLVSLLSWEVSCQEFGGRALVGNKASYVLPHSLKFLMSTGGA